MKSHFVPHLILLLAAFGIGFCAILFSIQYKKELPPEETASISPTPTPLQLVPPKNAFIAEIQATTGTVDRIPWDSPDTFPASSGATLFQEDEIVTHENATSVIAIPNVLKLTLSQGSDVFFGSMLPEKITLKQKSGSISYQMDETTISPVSIRSLNALVELASGSATITIEDGFSTINLLSGSAKLSTVAGDNNTYVWQLKPKDFAVINGTTGNVRTQGKLLSE